MFLQPPTAPSHRKGAAPLSSSAGCPQPALGTALFQGTRWSTGRKVCCSAILYLLPLRSSSGLQTQDFIYTFLFTGTTWLLHPGSLTQKPGVRLQLSRSSQMEISLVPSWSSYWVAVCLHCIVQLTQLNHRDGAIEPILWMRRLKSKET